MCRRSRLARRFAGHLYRARRRFYAADPDCRTASAVCTVIEIDDVTKYYGDRRVVDRLSLTVPAGDFCVLLGSSGCGQSTTFKKNYPLIAAHAGPNPEVGRAHLCTPVTL